MKRLAIARRGALHFCPAAPGMLASASALSVAAGRPLVRRGVTLIELMVALAITMIMMTAVITLFANVTTTVTSSRALVEISERLRSTRNRLQLDLAGHTASTIPPLRPEDGEGYLEIIEGPSTDLNPTSSVPGTATVYAAGSPATFTTYTNNIMGDADDVLMLTVRSLSEPFVGSMNNGATMIESPTAEVAWFAVPNGRTIPADQTITPTATVNGTAVSLTPAASVQLYTLYRRVLLIDPTYFNLNYTTLSGLYPPRLLQATYDLSAYPVYTSANLTTPTASMPNTLSTLTARENRYYHQPSLASGLPPTGFPFPVPPSTAVAPLVPLSGSTFSNVNLNRIGEDVVLTDVLSFDIRVFDPLAAVLATAGSDVLMPGDADYAPPASPANLTTPPTAGSPVGYGAFVDLGYGGGATGSTAPQTFFSAYPNTPWYYATYPPAWTGPGPMPGPGLKFLPAAQLLPQTYDTWSLGYEQNYIYNPALTTGDEDGNGIYDQGTDGLDDESTINTVASSSNMATNGIIDDPPQVSVTLPTINPTAGNITAPTVALASVGERETLAPYPYPLRGVQITIRVYEPDTQQVREVTVVQDFLPD